MVIEGTKSMDFTFLQDLADQLSELVAAANDLPGTVAFVAGAFSWFMVEQIIRRLASIMRTVLIVGLIAAGGVSAIGLINFFMNQGDTSGLTQPSDVQNL